MAFRTEGGRSSKSYDTYEATQLAKARKQAAEYETMRRAQANAAAAKAADIYDAALQNIEHQYAASAQDAERRYRALYDVNAVSGQIARREAENMIANTGVQNSGLGATHHTALSLHKSNADYMAASQKQKTVNAIMRELDSVRSRYQMRSSVEQNAIHQAADAAALAWRNVAEQSARNTAVALYASQIESDEAATDRAWEEYLLEYYLEQFAEQQRVNEQKRSDLKKQNNENIQKIRRYIEIVNRYLVDMTGKTLEELRQLEMQRQKAASQTELTPSQQEYYSRLGTGGISRLSPFRSDDATPSEKATESLYYNEHLKRYGLDASRAPIYVDSVPIVTAENVGALQSKLTEDLAVAAEKQRQSMNFSDNGYTDASMLQDTYNTFNNLKNTAIAIKTYYDKTGTSSGKMDHVLKNIQTSLDQLDAALAKAPADSYTYYSRKEQEERSPEISPYLYALADDKDPVATLNSGKAKVLRDVLGSVKEFNEYAQNRPIGTDYDDMNDVLKTTDYGVMMKFVRLLGVADFEARHMYAITDMRFNRAEDGTYTVDLDLYDTSSKEKETKTLTDDHAAYFVGFINAWGRDGREAAEKYLNAFVKQNGGDDFVR